MIIGPVRLKRFAAQINRFGIPFVPKIVDYLTRLIFGCWFPHTVKCGENIILGYGGLGVVVHGASVIGNNVHIDQHVTIGGNGRVFGVPRIEDDVYIGAGAKILGPIVIGKGSIIGANSVVLKNVPPNSVVVGVPGRIVKSLPSNGASLFHKK